MEAGARAGIARVSLGRIILIFNSDIHTKLEPRSSLYCLDLRLAHAPAHAIAWCGQALRVKRPPHLGNPGSAPHLLFLSLPPPPTTTYIPSSQIVFNFFKIQLFFLHKIKFLENTPVPHSGVTFSEKDLTSSPLPPPLPAVCCLPRFAKQSP